MSTEPKVVTTVEELDALPNRAIIADRNGYAWQRFEREWVSWLDPGESSAWMKSVLPATVLLEGKP